MRAPFSTFRKLWSAPVLLLLLGILVAQPAIALTQTRSPSSCVQVADNRNDWTNAGNALSSNNSYATVSLTGNERSDYIECTNYGFAIPTNATIDGIVVSIERKASDTSIQDRRVRTIKGGNYSNDNLATSTAYTTSDVIEAHGSATALWGETWTDADINASNFGAALSVETSANVGTARTVSVDHIEITVHYTEFAPELTINSAMVNSAATVTVAPGASISVSYSVTTTGGNTEVEGTLWKIGTTSPPTTCANSTPDSPNNTNGTYTTGFTATAPATPGTYNLYLIANSADGCNGGESSAVFTLSNAIVVAEPPPSVSSINRTSFNPTKSNTSVSWTVTFNTSVTGVDTGDFTLVQAGGATGATISSVSGSGTTWTVTANTGTGASGTVRLDLVDNDTIVNASSVALGGAGAGNGNFSGQTYTLLPSVCNGAADIIFCDDFERTNTGSVGNGWTTTENNAWNCSGTTGNQRCSGIDSDIPPFSTYVNPRANPTRSMFTRWDRVWVTSPTINMAGKVGGQFSFWMRRGHDDFSECPEAAGENYLVEYYASDNTWKSLAQYPSSPSAALCDGKIWTPTIELPADAMHANFKLRFYQPSGSGDSGSGGAPNVRGYDYWHMDDVIIREKAAPSFTGAFCDNFEGGLGRWSITSEGVPSGSAIGDAGLGTLTNQSATHSLDLRWGYVTASTFKTDMTGVTGSITYWIKSGTTTDRDPETGEDLVVEYLNSSGTWTALATYAGSAAAGTVYSGTHVLPADAKHANFRLRFRHLNASGYDLDYWHVDDVCVGDPIPAVDLAITKARVGALVPGTNVSYNLSVKNNNGPDTLAGSVEVVDTLPSGLSYVGATGTDWVCSANAQIVTCNWSGTLAPNALAPTLTLTVAVADNAAGVLTNTATVSGTVVDSNSANDTATNTGTVIVATLVAEYHLEDLSWNGTAGELKDTAGYAGGPFDGTAVGSTYPALTLNNPALANSPGTCGYATMGGQGAFSASSLPVSIAAGAKTSVAFWMYWDGTDSVMPIGWNQHALLLAGGYFGFTTNSSSDIYGIASTGLVNGWHHVVAVFTNGSVDSNLLFIDGVAQTLEQLQGSPNFTNAVVGSSLRIGGWMQDGNHRFTGRLDEVLIYKDALVQTDVTNLYAAKHTCAPAVDHYELSLPTSSIACLATTATVTACTTSTTPCSSPATVVSGKVATLATNGGSLGSTTVTFNASGIATTTLSYPAAADGTVVAVTLSGEEVTAVSPRKCCPNGVSCAVGNSCSTTFNTTGFVFSATANGAVATIPTQVAGTSSGTYYLRAVKTLDNSAHSCGAAFSGNQSIDFAYECNNPTTCYGSNLLSVNGGTATTISRNDNGGLLGFYSYASVPMSFDANGNAPFTFIYSDVGQLTLKARKALTADNSTTPPIAAATLTGNSNAFVVKPAGFVLSDIKQTASPNLANPAEVDAGGTKFVKAGEEFSVTVTAVTSTGSTAYNYGRETTPEGVKLTSALVTGLGLTNNPLLVNSTAFGSFTNGVASGTTFSWNEVGIITLTPSVSDGSYLAVGDVTGTTSDNVGRFYAAKFALSAGSITNRADLCPNPPAVQPAGCPASFTYAGEPMNAMFTLTALAVDGTTQLQNYSYSATAAKNFAKLNPMAAVTAGSGGPLGIGGVNSGAARTPFPPCAAVPAHPCLLPSQATAGTFASGIANVVLPFTLFRSTTPTGPFAALSVGAAPQDSDGAILATYDLDTVNVVAGASNHGTVGSTAVRYGRLQMSNAFGSEKTNLAMAIQAQYWSGNSWVINSADNGTTLPANAFFLVGAPAGTGASAVTINGGNGTLILTKPSPTTTASVDVALNLGTSGNDQSCLGSHGGTAANMPWFRSRYGSCAATYDRDPSARATFGIYAPETRRSIHVREQF